MKFAVQDKRLMAKGELDTRDLAEFERTASELLGSTQGEIVLDFAEVDYMSSSFVGELMSLRSKLAAQGRGFVLKPSPVVRQLLELTGLSSKMILID